MRAACLVSASPEMAAPSGPDTLPASLRQPRISAPPAVSPRSAPILCAYTPQFAKPNALRFRLATALHPAAAESRMSFVSTIAAAASLQVPCLCREEARNDRCGLFPAASLGLQLFASVACQLIKARFAIIFRG